MQQKLQTPSSKTVDLRGELVPPVEKNRVKKIDLQKYDQTPLYFYTEKDSLNRITILKEPAKEVYVVAGRYSGYENDSRVYNRLTDDEKKEVEKLLRMGRKDAAITFL